MVSITLSIIVHKPESGLLDLIINKCVAVSLSLDGRIPKDLNFQKIVCGETLLSKQSEKRLKVVGPTPWT
jgi:hypothetical protein